MKRYFLLGAVSFALSACGVLEVPNAITGSTTSSTQNTSQVFRLANQHWSDVAKIRAEASRLGIQVQNGTLTKVQAAQLLNRFRLNLVGRNTIDDSVYEVYQQAAVDSQRGSITPAQSRAYVENALKGWQQRWPNMANRPDNPAFTNFLLEYMGMTPLH